MRSLQQRCDMHGNMFPAGLDGLAAMDRRRPAAPKPAHWQWICQCFSIAPVWPRTSRQYNMKVRVIICRNNTFKLKPLWHLKTHSGPGLAEINKYSNWTGTEGPRSSSYATCLSPFFQNDRNKTGIDASVFFAICQFEHVVASVAPVL